MPDSVKKPAERNGQETRRARTRDLLVETASRLFSQSHPEAVSIDDITQAAGLAKGTFYNHFTDKTALSAEVRRQVMAKTDAAITALNQGVDDAPRRIARGICVYAAMALDDPVHAGLLAQNLPLEMAATLKASGAIEDIGLGIASGRLRVATRESGAVFLLGAGGSLVHRLLAEPNPAAARLLTQQVVSMTLRGLGVDSAEADLIAAQACQEILVSRAQGIQ